LVVHVTLHMHLQRVTAEGRTSQIEVKLADDASLQDLVDLMGIPYESEAIVLVVNRQVVEISQRLKSGDEVDLIPAISGG
jgi:molybdopterin converting factor small subunit